MTKVRILVTILCFILCLLFCGCGPGGKTTYPFGHVYYFEGHDVYAYMTELTTAESYHTPDGTDYLPEDGGIFFIVKGQLHIAPWYISKETVLRGDCFDRSIPLFCDPIIEEIESGESTVTLLFCVKDTDYHAQSEISLDLQITNAAGQQHSQEFVLADFGGSPNPPYKPIV